MILYDITYFRIKYSQDTGDKATEDHLYLVIISEDTDMFMVQLNRLPAKAVFYYILTFKNAIERGSEMIRQEPVQNKKETNVVSDKRPTGWLRGASMSALLLVSVVLIFVILRFYYVELDNQLFVERSNHLQEITEKVADIFDITIARSWDSVNTLEQFLFMEGAKAQTEDELMQRLEDMSRFRSKDNIFLLLDNDFRYYASDGSKGYW